MKTLTIISHTEHYKTPQGEIVGLGSTVTEINHLTTVFDAIIHVAMLHKTPPPENALAYSSNNIKFVPLPALGGPNINDKLSMIWKAPSVLRTIHKAVAKTDYFQFRAPTGIGVFVIPYLVVFSSKKGWFKYAGNWRQDHAPIAYRFQRWLLKKQNRAVTINGIWKDQPLHCLSFENPCLTSEDIKKGDDIRSHKLLNANGISLCFVGRLEKEKGLDLFIDTVLSLGSSEISKIKVIHIVGHGENLKNYLEKTKNCKTSFIFHGFLSRPDVHKIYMDCHVIVLPSASEGFPKVVSEAMNYGCLPIVSNISSIGHYITHDVNGFMVYPITLKRLKKQIIKCLNLSNVSYSAMINAEKLDILKFTYNYYNERISKDVLSN